MNNKHINQFRRGLRLIAVLTIALCSFSAKASVFNFSYTFGSGDVASGSLTGTQNGIYVESVSNVSVFYNGIALTGNPNLYQPYSFAAGCCWVPSPPVISFNGNLNNFIFADAPPNNPAQTNVFIMNGTDIDYWDTGSLLPLRYAAVGMSSGYAALDKSIGGSAVGGYGAFDANRWSLTAAVWLFGSGLLGLMGMARRKAA
jgi:hypothetical protein